MTLQWSKKHCQACFRWEGRVGSGLTEEPGRNSAGAEPSEFPDVGGLETLGTASDVGLDAGRQRKTPRGWIARGVSFGLCCITDVASVVFDPPGHGL